MNEQPYQTGPAPAARNSPWRKVIGVLGTIVLAVVIILVIRGIGDHASGGGGLCTSNACIVQDLQQSLNGVVDKGDEVTTKVVCQQSSVKDDGNGIYAATCTVTHSDGTVDAGTGTLETKQNEATFVPSG